VAMHDIAVAVAVRAGRQRCRIQPRIRLGDGKTALDLAFDNGRQHATFLFFSSEHHDRIGSKDIEMDRRCSLQGGTRLGHCLHDQGRLGDAETCATEFLRHSNSQPAGIGDCLVKFLRKAAIFVLLQPVAVVELGAEPTYVLADLLMRIGKSIVHRWFPRIVDY
jgi:hypothetical protein